MRVTELRLRDFRSFPDSGPLELANVNVLVGRNNSGKSSILRALYALQAGSNVGIADVRHGASGLSIEMSLADVRGGVGLSSWIWARDSYSVTIAIGDTGGETRTVRDADGNDGSIEILSQQEPLAFIYPLFNRRPAYYNETVNVDQSNLVTSDWNNLAARLDRLVTIQNPAAQELIAAMQEVLGIQVAAVPSTNGKQVGIYTDANRSILIDRMGAGVANAVTLLASIVEAESRLFLIEEPENDLHPAALRQVLRVIERLSVKNQFVVSTHSHVVLRTLAAIENAKVFAIEQGTTSPVPVSEISEVAPTLEARTEILRRLGYELADFDLYDGWLLLEESSAERLIREYLIKWFAPGLIGRLRTVSTGGNSGIEPTFEDFRRLFLFAHLEPRYRERAWVWVDGDADGVAIVSRLRERYATWPASHFDHWTVPAFEYFYPAPFRDRYSPIEALSHQERRTAKKELLDDLLAWIADEETNARELFEESAAEVIEKLQILEAAIVG